MSKSSSSTRIEIFGGFKRILESFYQAVMIFFAGCMWSPPIIGPIVKSRFYILCLGGFIAAAEQDDDRLSDLPQINPITRPKIDLEF